MNDKIYLSFIFCMNFDIMTKLQYFTNQSYDKVHFYKLEPIDLQIYQILIIDELINKWDKSSICV